MATEIRAARRALTQQAVLEQMLRRFAGRRFRDEALRVDTWPPAATGKPGREVVRADLQSRGVASPDLRCGDVES